MSPPFVGLSDLRLMSLVGSSVAPPTWQSHGKAWAEWLLYGTGRVYLLNESGCYKLPLLICCSCGIKGYLGWLHRKDWQVLGFTSS